MAGAKYINIFCSDDKKKNPKCIDKWFTFGDFEPEDLDKYIEEVNTNNYAVYYNINPLRDKPRANVNIIKYNYLFLDLDDGATEEHKNLIEEYLSSKGFYIEYICKSGGGYHFFIPIDLDVKKQSVVSNFLNYLKINVCDKIDTRVNDPSRITRVPSSMHFKNNPFKLLTLHSKFREPGEVKKNTELLEDYQEENKINSTETKYTKSIDRKDVFFTKILSNEKKWQKVFDCLNKHDVENEGKGTNQIFNKNLSIFCLKNPDCIEISKKFFKMWNNKWVTVERFEHFLKKVSSSTLQKIDEEENNVNYFELLKWAKKYKLSFFIPFLESQLRTTFLDKFEIYYMDEEKNDSQYLLYFNEKNFFVEKNLNSLIESIYHESSLYNIDLVKELNVKTTKSEKVQKDDGSVEIKERNLSFFDVYKNILHKLKSTLLKENRIQKINNISYLPRDEKILKQDGNTYFNIYKKPSLLNQEIKMVKENSFPMIKDLIMNLTSNEEDNYKWFINWLSFIMQNPDKKLPTAVIFQGEQGTGKGVFKNLILDNLFGKNIQEINQTHLESNFNEYLMGKQIIVANEVIHNENKALLPNILKNLITDEYITINRKFKKELVIKNYTHWIFCTNNDNPLKIDKDDRRYSVFYSKRLKGNEENAFKFVSELNQNLDYELNNFYSFLMNFDFNEALARKPLMTEAKKEIVELNKDTSERFLEYFKNFDTLRDCFMSLQDVNCAYLPIEISGDEFILTDILYLFYESYCQKFKERGVFNKQTFSKKLSNLGVRSQVRKPPGEKQSKRFYSITELGEVITQ